jgi:hypothetical protein
MGRTAGWNLALSKSNSQMHPDVDVLLIPVEVRTPLSQSRSSWYVAIEKSAQWPAGWTPPRLFSLTAVGPQRYSPALKLALRLLRNQFAQWRPSTGAAQAQSPRHQPIRGRSHPVAAFCDKRATDQSLRLAVAHHRQLASVMSSHYRSVQQP